jgi:tRNA(fMet)-specific endonuclease VapC
VASRLILDTGVIIAAERGQVDLRTVIGNADPAISVITAAELPVGIQRASPGRRDVMAVNVEGLLAAMSIEPFTIDVARMHAHLYAYAKQVGRQRVRQIS